MKTVRELHDTIFGLEMELTRRYLELGVNGFSDASERAEWSRQLMAASFGRNAVIWISDGDATPKYFPSVMVRVDAFRVKDVITGSSNQDFHPAFKVGSNFYSRLWIGKYQATTITSNAKVLALSLRGMDPAVSLSFDTAKAYCANNGSRHHLMTAAEWAAITLRCRAHGFQPRGNNYYGRDSADADSAENYGVPTYFSSEKIARVGTGTGPMSWADDGSPLGIWDLNGNVREWLAGLRFAAGEIQVVANNDAAADGADLTRDSALWKALAAADGALMSPEVTFSADDSDATDAGVGATCRMSPAAANGSTVITINTSVANPTVDSQYVYSAFDDIDVDGVNVATCHEILQSLAIAPQNPGGNTHGGDTFYLRCPEAGTGDAYVETIPYRGGHWANAGNAGVFYSNCSPPRSYSSHTLGFRPAFLG